MVVIFLLEYGLGLHMRLWLVCIPHGLVLAFAVKVNGFKRGGRGTGSMLLWAYLSLRVVGKFDSVSKAWSI